MTARQCSTCLFYDASRHSDTCRPCLAAEFDWPNWAPKVVEVADLLYGDNSEPPKAFAGLRPLAEAAGWKPDEIGDELADEPIFDAIAAAAIKPYIADEAKRITDGARRGAYGTPEDNFGRIARFWEAYMQNTGRDVKITAADVSPMMRLMKEARLCETPDHLDSHIDLVGYTLTGAEVNGVKIPD